MSRIPPEFRLLESIRRIEHVFPSPELVEDFARMTGMPPERFVMFRPARLALHEVIVRVTADIAVSEGESEEVFGRNFRQIALTILANYVAPRLCEIEHMHEDLRERVTNRVRTILDARLGPVAAPSPRRALPPRLFGRLGSIQVPVETLADREHLVVSA